MIIKNGVNMELQSSSTLQIQKKHVPSKTNIDDQKLIYNVEKLGHNHGWGVHKRNVSPQNHSQDTILNDHYVYRFIYFGEFILSLDIHILCD